MENNFYTIWENLSKRYRGYGDVTCFVPLVGYFGFRRGEIVKIQPKTYNKSGWLQSGRTYSKCTIEELSELQISIDAGIPSLIMQPYYVANEPILLMYGTGRTGSNPNYKS